MTGPVPENEQTKPESTEEGRDTVLFADDDPAVRGATAEILRAYGYSVLEAADGEDAIQTYTENRDRITLLLLDIDMPKKDGREVYRHLRKTYPGIKVIFISGRYGQADLDLRAEDERVGFIAKPVSPPDLITKIKEALED